MASNQFKIKDYTILNGTVDTLTVNGHITLFSERIHVYYSLHKDNTNTPTALGDTEGINNTSGTLVILRSSLLDTSEASITAEVATQLGLELV